MCPSSLFFCVINIHHTERERNPLCVILFPVFSRSRLDEGKLFVTVCCIEKVCRCVYEKRERETDGLLMLREFVSKGSCSRALEAKEKEKQTGMFPS